MKDSEANAKAIFLEALDCQGADALLRLLDKACGADAVLRTRIEELLRAHRDAGCFLRGAEKQDATRDDPIAERPGTIVGPYKLMEQIGEGGMGLVFVGEQHHPVRRKVAVKVIKPGLDTREVIARFEAERQALALMDHPNIARVLDAGATESGRPYFVMELVRGVGITEFCDENRLTPRERLELFVHVCQAVQHAHHKGIIHRDLKATNILVTLHDGTPVVKVIDFGVAKAIGQQLTDKTIYTRFAQMIGTPMYMSPEQAEMSGLDIDTRSDIYALGVLLYELLTGATPFDKERLRTASYDEIRRIVREEEPPRPSQRISTLLADALTAVSAQRRIDPKRLRQLFRGELDWIVMKALEKDRSRRYETASAFAADVQRYLHDEPVLACPPTVGYRLRKIARRHKGPVLAISLVVLALVGGIIGTTWGMIRATDAQADAVNEAKQKEDALLDREAALTAARKSKRDADEKLFESCLGQARGIRLSKRPGQRFESLEVLKRATELARFLDLPAEKFHELRNGVIACLALPDLYLTGPWLPSPRGSYSTDVDEARALYAQTDRQGNCTVRRVADDVELQRLPGLGEPAAPFLSADGKFLAVTHIHLVGSAYTGVAVHLWMLGETTGGRLEASQIGSEPNARRVEFHPNGHQVALAYNDGAIRLFELPSGRQLGKVLPPDTLTREIEIAFHPSEPLVAVCSYFSRVVQIRDVHTGAVVASLPQATAASHAVWHPDGQTLAVGAGEGGLIRLHDRTTLQPYRSLQYGSGGGLQLTFNHAGDRLAAVGWNGVPELFDVGTGQKLFATTGYIGRRFSRDGRRLAGAAGSKLGVWQVGDAREYRTLVRKAQPETFYHSVALHPDGRLLAAGMTDGFGLWDLATGSELAFVPLDGGSNGVPDVRFEPSGALLTASFAGVFRWPLRADPKTAERLSIGPPERLLPRAGRIGQSDDGKVLVACNRAVAAWQAYAGGWIVHADRPDQPIRLDAGADIADIVVSPNGRWVVTVTQSGLGKVWNARDGSLVKPLAEWGAFLPSFSPDSLWLSTYADDGRIWAVGTWKPGPRVGPWGVFAPDSQLMAVQPTTGVIRLVDRVSGREFARLEDPEFDATSALFFTPDGTKLIGLGNKKVKSIRVWDLRLIRRHLKTLGLDWERPDYPPAGDGRLPSVIPQKVSVVGLERLIDWTAWSDRAKAHAQAGQWTEAIAAYSKAINLNADSVYSWSNRGESYAELSCWKEALADFAIATKLSPNGAWQWYQLANAYLASGQRDAYRKVCAEMMNRYEKNKNPYWASRILYVCLATADPVADLSALIPLAEVAANGKPEARSLGAALYRNRKYPEAIAKLNEASHDRAWDNLFLAMAHHQLGNGAKAREHLKIAVERIEKSRYPWTERTESASLRREAEALIHGTSKDSQPKGKSNAR